VHKEIKLLRDENRDQNAQIDHLNGKIELQYERLHQIVSEKVDQKMKEYDHPSPGVVRHRQKRPFRLIPTAKDGLEINQQQPFYEQPTSCSDLALLGHTLNGFYVVKTDGNKPTKTYI